MHTTVCTNGEPKKCKSCRTGSGVTYKHFLVCSDYQDIDTYIKEGSWDALVLALRQIIPKMEGLEYHVSEKQD